LEVLPLCSSPVTGICNKLPPGIVCSGTKLQFGGVEMANPEMNRENWNEVVHAITGLDHRFYRVGFQFVRDGVIHGEVTIPGSGRIAHVVKISEHTWQEIAC
jgi:hypothetical protein